jgi:putative protease
MAPEILAPAGDEEALRAAIAAGADAVYLGLSSFSARARATNFGEDALVRAMELLHRHGRRGYVALNTLVFDAELPKVAEAIRRAAEVGVDALIVQDLGVARLARAIAPALPLHASTQMTCTDAESVELARELGASRVILARELSIEEVRAIRARTDVELEVFVHGALCVAYSGQCLTSEAIGGRSANRGACAQACRLPYELVVDGAVRDTADRAFLLSPEDLEASALVPALAEAGVVSLKIEGRLKGPAYVAATTTLYREAVDALELAPSTQTSLDLEPARRRALATFSRGSGPGFLAGVDHQRLVGGTTCDHRGRKLGEVHGVVREEGKVWLAIAASEPIEPGYGLLVRGGRAGEGELGGRVWLSRRRGETWLVWLGPERRVDPNDALAGREVFLSDDPVHEREALAIAARQPTGVRVDFVVTARVGEPLVVSARCGERVAQATSETALEAARKPTTAAAIEQVVREKLGRLGDTPFALGALTVELSEVLPMVAPSSLNQLRRAVAEQLATTAPRSFEVTDVTPEALLADADARLARRSPPPAGLFVLCRNLEQARAAREAGADGVWLDILELQGTGAAVRALRADGPGFVGVAPPRIRKPGEEKIDRYLASLEPDGILVRGLGALREASVASDGVLRVGDFSLNATNRLTVDELLGRGLAAFTPSFDLDAAQLLALLRAGVGPFAEVVVHHPMPLFHMEHCVFARELSTGRDHRDCGRPCERHELSLRDRAGVLHPVLADVGCRNTVFHAAAQSAATLVGAFVAAGVCRTRVELVREDAAQVRTIVRAYRELLAGARVASDVVASLRAESTFGVVRGSLRVLSS